MSTDEKFLALIDRHLDGSLEQGQVDEFLHAIEEDPKAARLLAEQTVEMELLLQALSQEKRPAEAAGPAPHLLPRARKHRNAEDNGRPSKRSWPLWTVAATCMAVALLAFLKAPGRTEGVMRELLAIAFADGAGLVVERGGVRIPINGSAPLYAGDLVITAPSGKARITYPGETTSVDINHGSRLELGMQTGAKRLTLHSGQTFMEVSRQPAGQPLLVNPGKPGEATVLGTAFEVSVNGDETLLRVKSGTVLFGQRRPIPVTDGHFSKVRVGGSPEAPRAISSSWIGAWRKGVTVVNFGPASLNLPEGVKNDSGEAFDPVRGFGWKDRSRDGKTRKAQVVGDLQKTLDADPLRSTAYSVGSRETARTWALALPNGEYEVSVSCGYWVHPGRHHLRI